MVFILSICNIGYQLQYEIPDCGHKNRDYMPQRVDNSFYLQPITTDDILLEIKRLKHNKSPGYDLIGSKIVKLCPETFAMNLAKIYNEKIICRRLVSFLEGKKILYCYPYGFRESYSTVLALIEITNYIKRLLDEKIVISVL